MVMHEGNGILTGAAIHSHLGVMLREADLDSAGWKGNLKPDISIDFFSGTGPWKTMYFYF